MADLGVLARLTQQASDNIFREHNFRSSLFAQARQELQTDRQLRLQESNAIANRMAQADENVARREQNAIMNQHRAAQLKEQTAYHDAMIRKGGAASLSPIVSANTQLFNIQKAKAAQLQAVADMEKTNENRASVGLPPRPMPPTTDFGEMESNLRAIAGSAGTAGGGRTQSPPPPPVTRPSAVPFRATTDGGDASPASYQRPPTVDSPMAPLLNPDTTANIPDIAPQGTSSVEPSLFPGGQQAAPMVATPVTPPPGGFVDSTQQPPASRLASGEFARPVGLTPEQAAAEQVRQATVVAQRSQESQASVFKSVDVLAANPTTKPIPVKAATGEVLTFREKDPGAYEGNKAYIDTLESKIIPLADIISTEKDEQTRNELQAKIDRIKYVVGNLNERAPKPLKEKEARVPSEGDVEIIMAIRKFNQRNKIKSAEDYKDLEAEVELADSESMTISDAYETLRLRGSLTDDLRALDPVKPAGAAGKVFPTSHPFVENDGGSRSNVMLSSFNISGKERVIPTMVNGKQLSDDEAVAVAKKNGIDNYPSFDTAEEATAWAEANHGNIDEDGRLRQAPTAGQPERKPGGLRNLF